MVFHVKGMVLAGWFYIIRRHITVETPLDKRNLERRDRIFVRTTRVKNHPNRQPRRGLFFFFSSPLFFRVWSAEDPPFNPRFASLPCFRRKQDSETRRGENEGEEEKLLFSLTIVLEAKKKKKRRKIFEQGGKIVRHGVWIFRSVIGGQLASAKLISKARRWDPTQQKPLHVSPSLPPAHLRLTVHNGGANYPYLRTFMPTPYLATPDCFVLANN